MVIDDDRSVSKDRVESRVTGAAGLEARARPDPYLLRRLLDDGHVADGPLRAGVAPDGQLSLPSPAEIIVGGWAPEVGLRTAQDQLGPPVYVGGDHAFPLVEGEGEIGPGMFCEDKEALIESLEEVASFEPRTIYLSHGDTIDNTTLNKAIASLKK